MDQSLKTQWVKSVSKTINLLEFIFPSLSLLQVCEL